MYYTNNFLTSQKSLYLESFKASHAFHGWEAVNNHVFGRTMDNPVTQASLSAETLLSHPGQEISSNYWHNK